jgi:hypothetical protein
MGIIASTWKLWEICSIQPENLHHTSSATIQLTRMKHVHSFNLLFLLLSATSRNGWTRKIIFIQKPFPSSLWPRVRILLGKQLEILLFFLSNDDLITTSVFAGSRPKHTLLVRHISWPTQMFRHWYIVWNMQVSFCYSFTSSWGTPKNARIIESSKLWQKKQLYFDTILTNNKKNYNSIIQ